MRPQSIKLWQAKIKLLLKEEKEWAKKWNQADRAMIRLGRRIEELEKKIELELARAK